MTTDTLTPKPRGVTDILERELQSAYRPAVRGGRQRSDIEDGGSIAHAVPASEGGYGFTPALCGITPGRRSIGWSSWVPERVTCPRCIRKQTEAELQSAYDALIAIDYPDPVARDHALRTLGIAAKRWMESK